MSREEPISKGELELRFSQFETRLKGFEQNLGNGFSGVHSRLDTMNGAVAENTKFRMEAQWERAHDKDLRSEFRQWMVAAIAIVAVINGVAVAVMK